jgi:hypothetical protein
MTLLSMGFSVLNPSYTTLNSEGIRARAPPALIPARRSTRHLGAKTMFCMGMVSLPAHFAVVQEVSR